MYIYIYKNYYTSNIYFIYLLMLVSRLSILPTYTPPLQSSIALFAPAIFFQSNESLISNQ